MTDHDLRTRVLARAHRSRDRPWRSRDVPREDASRDTRCRRGAAGDVRRRRAPLPRTVRGTIVGVVTDTDLMGIGAAYPFSTRSADRARTHARRGRGRRPRPARARPGAGRRPLRPDRHGPGRGPGRRRHDQQAAPARDRAAGDPPRRGRGSRWGAPHGRSRRCNRPGSCARVRRRTEPSTPSIRTSPSSPSSSRPGSRRRASLDARAMPWRPTRDAATIDGWTEALGRGSRPRRDRHRPVLDRVRLPPGHGSARRRTGAGGRVRGASTTFVPAAPGSTVRSTTGRRPASCAISSSRARASTSAAWT